MPLNIGLKEYQIGLLSESWLSWPWLIGREFAITMTNREWAYHIVWWAPPMPGCRGVGGAGGGGRTGAGGGGAVLN